MRRSAVKSRAEKSRSDSGPVNAAPPPPSVQPVETVDTVPLRITQSNWTNIITEEEGEELVVDIIEELMEVVMDRCCQMDLQRQLIPFSVCWARNNLVQTLECLFLMRDEGMIQNENSFGKRTQNLSLVLSIRGLRDACLWCMLLRIADSFMTGL